MPKSTKTKKYDMFDFFTVVLCCIVIFYVSGIHMLLNILADSNKEMLSEFKDLHKDISNQLAKFELILREDTSIR